MRNDTGRATGARRASPASDALVVVGGGVIGLTSAVVLAERGHRVRVVSRDTADETTSAVAGALCWPYRIEPRHRVLDWSIRTFGRLSELALRPEETGVRMVAGTMGDASAGAGGTAPAANGEPPVDPWLDTMPGLRAATPSELPPGYSTGWRARTPLLDMPVHLRYLERRLTAAGGVIERRAVASLAEALSEELSEELAEGLAERLSGGLAERLPEAPTPGGRTRTVVNCSGLGARELVPDPSVRPVRGQLVIVENPGIKEWFVAADGAAEETTYLLPQPYGVVLGGTARPGAWSREPDPEVSARIVRRCARVDPRLARAKVLREKVGLRPWRPSVRLESERLPDGTLCVHNYGHGGAGVTVAWGCAEEVARALEHGGMGQR